jgi:hypothetical protein
LAICVILNIVVPTCSTCHLLLLGDGGTLINDALNKGEEIKAATGKPAPQG